MLNWGFSFSPQPHLHRQKENYFALLLKKVNNFLQQSPNWEADRFSASQKIPAFYGIRRFNAALRLQPYPILSQIIPAHVSPSNPMPLFQRTCPTKLSFQLPRCCEIFRDIQVFTVRSFCTSPNTQAREPHLPAILYCLFKTCTVASHLWRSFLHPQPETALCCSVDLYVQIWWPNVRKRIIT